MFALLMTLLSCLALGVLATSVWFVRGPKGRLAISHSFRARAQWRMWLAGERAWKHLDARYHDVTLSRSIAMGEARSTEWLCLLLGAQWVPGVGYARRWVRQVLYHLRFGRSFAFSWLLDHALDALAAYQWHYGRYEGISESDSQLVARTLDIETPDETYGPYAIFRGPFPWSEDAVILTHVDEVGFFTYSTYLDRSMGELMWGMAKNRWDDEVAAEDVEGLLV